MNRSFLQRAIVIALAASALQACSLTREVRPVGQGNWAAGASLGGPLFTNLGGAIPTPIFAPYARYGILNNLDLDFGLDLTPASVQGIDVGAAYEFRDQSGGIPAVMGGARLYGYFNASALTGQTDTTTGQHFSLEPTAFEEIYANVSWKVGRPWLLYAGLDLFAQAQNAVFAPSIVAGAEYRFTHIGIQAEVKQEEFDHNQLFSTLTFIGPGNYGALAFQIGINIYPMGAP